MADEDLLTKAMLVGTAKGIIGDTYDPGFDPDFFNVWCDVTLQPRLIGPAENPYQIRIQNPAHPMLVALTPMAARFETGVLRAVRGPAPDNDTPTSGERAAQNDTPGIPLLAETAGLELPADVHLVYDVKFGAFTINGARYQFDDFTFAAPTTDATIDISRVDRINQLPSHGQDVVLRMLPDDVTVVDGNKIQFSSQGIALGDLLEFVIPVEGLADSTATGRSVIKAADAEAVRATIDVRPITGTPARLFIVLDDCTIGQLAALDAAEKRGQVLNMAICTNYVTSPGVHYFDWTDLKRVAMRGHGIMAHSKTHQWLTTATESDLIEEFDYPLKAISAATGVEVRDWVYPSSKHNIYDGEVMREFSPIDSAALGRYRRVFAGIWEGDQWRHKWWRRKPFVCGRYGWASSNHAAVKSQITAAAAAQEDIVIYTHATDGSNWATEGVTLAEFTEVLDLAVKLGMKVANINEFDTASPWLVDPGFEDAANFEKNFEVISSLPDTGYTAEVAAVTPAATLPGTQSLHLALTSAGSNYVAVRQRLLIPSAPFAEQAIGAVLGARVKCNISSGSGGVTVRLYSVDYLGALWPNYKISNLWTSSSWSEAGDVQTPEFTNYTDSLLVEYRLSGVVGECWIDNAQLAMGTGDLVA